MTLGPTDDDRSGDQPTLGAQLRAAREASGRSVEQVSNSTRIRTNVIRDLENDVVTSSGGAVYARGHLRAIASAVGIDPAPLVARFDLEHDGTVPGLIEATPLPGPVGPVSLRGNEVARERMGPRWGLAVAGAAAVLVAIMAIGYANPENTPTEAAGGRATPGSPRATPSVVRTPDPESIASKPPVTGAQLRVRVIGGKSWVSIRNATSTLYAGVLTDGQFKDFSDPTQLRVTVGYAPAVDLNCGGRDSGPVGTANKVLRFSCSATGLSPA